MTQFLKIFRLRTCSVALLVLTGATTSVAQFDTSDPAFTAAAARNPAVASVLDGKLETPEQKLSAVFILLDLDEENVARALWQDLTSDTYGDDVRAALVRKFGAARFLNLSRRETTNELAGARQFADSCLEASSTLNRAPERLAKLIDNLSSDSAIVRQSARADLAVTGDAGAIACFEALSQVPAGKDHEKLRAELMLTLAKMRPSVEPMLIAALSTSHGQFRRDAAELAGHLYLQAALPWLSAFAAGADSDPEVISAAVNSLTKMGVQIPGSYEAQTLLRRNIQRLEATPVQPEDDLTWWMWHHTTPPETNPGPGKMVSSKFSAAMINKLALNRLAETLLTVGVPNEADQQTALIYYLETVHVIGKAEDRELEKLPTQQLSTTLARAMQSDQIAAAKSCAVLLGEQANIAALQSVQGQRSPLALALVHANRELRFAALEAIMKISPQRSFAGASGVSQALWYFADSAGMPQALTASSTASLAGDWAGQLRGLGYDAIPVNTGRDAVLRALQSRRLELILLDSDIGRPHVREVVYGFRTHTSLKRVPVAVLSSSHKLLDAQRIAQTDAYVIATPRPHSEKAMQATLAELTALSGEKLTAEHRTEQAATALGWLAELLEKGHPYDELLRNSDTVSHTLFNLDLTEASLRLLTVLGTANSQRLLIDYASIPTLPIKSRQAAANAFAKSVKKFGKQLTPAELLRQYDRYNASETADSETQKVLSQVLDILEKQK